MFKKIVMSLLLVSSMLMAYTSDKSVYTNEATSVEIDGGFVFLYNRQEQSINDFSEYKISKSLHHKMCSNKNFRTTIETGTAVNFIYLFKDGVMSISVSECY